jgi:hypothetical protein
LSIAKGNRVTVGGMGMGRLAGLELSKIGARVTQASPSNDRINLAATRFSALF